MYVVCNHHPKHLAQSKLASSHHLPWTGVSLLMDPSDYTNLEGGGGDGGKPCTIIIVSTIVVGLKDKLYFTVRSEVYIRVSYTKIKCDVIIIMMTGIEN